MVPRGAASRLTSASVASSTSSCATWMRTKNQALFTSKSFTGMSPARPARSTKEALSTNGDLRRSASSSAARSRGTPNAAATTTSAAVLTLIAVRTGTALT